MWRATIALMLATCGVVAVGFGALVY